MNHIWNSGDGSESDPYTIKMYEGEMFIHIIWLYWSIWIPGIQTGILHLGNNVGFVLDEDGFTNRFYFATNAITRIALTNKNNAQISGGRLV